MRLILILTALVGFQSAAHSGKIVDFREFNP